METLNSRALRRRLRPHGRLSPRAFANGNRNGRSGRVWVNWAALHYGSPSFVRLRPRRQGLGYALASYASMGRDHSVMVGVRLQLLDDRLRHGPEAASPVVVLDNHWHVGGQGDAVRAALSGRAVEGAGHRPGARMRTWEAPGLGAGPGAR